MSIQNSSEQESMAFPALIQLLGSVLDLLEGGVEASLADARLAKNHLALLIQDFVGSLRADRFVAEKDCLLIQILSPHNNVRTDGLTLHTKELPSNRLMS